MQSFIKWVYGLALSLGGPGLFVVAFLDSSFISLPQINDLLVVLMVVRNKTLIVLGYLLIPVIHVAQAGDWTVDGFTSTIAAVALSWFFWTLAVVLARVLYLVWKHDFRISMIWFVKLVTDPLTDIVAYFPRRLLRA